MILTTPRLRLVLQTPQETLAIVESLPPELRAEVSPAWLAQLRELTRADPWRCGFIVCRLSDGKSVGSCGFKGPPDAEKCVEIAYEVHPDSQGRGYATEAAIALTQFAVQSGQAATVRGHTMPGHLASERVLHKAGFELLGLVEDPEDGAVNRWEKSAVDSLNAQASSN
ncbi:MAG: GNAT family N-acetyltransferase [Planctomycetales bacterium]|nr:GNAT family N-acetyltransferase [Planctomycetales bacterium]